MTRCRRREAGNIGHLPGMGVSRSWRRTSVSESGEHMMLVESGRASEISCCRIGVRGCALPIVGPDATKSWRAQADAANCDHSLHRHHTTSHTMIIWRTTLGSHKAERGYFRRSLECQLGSL